MNDIISSYFEADEFSKNIKTVSFKKGEVILRPYDDMSHIYAIAEGLVKIYNVDSKGKEYIAVIYGPGDFYPLAWLIDQRRPPIYFKAIADSKIHVVPIKVFQKHLKEDALLSNIFIYRAIEQFAYFATTVNNLGLRSGKEKLYYRLLVLATRFGKNKNNLTLIPRINHSDLAATIGMTRESVSKEISNLEKRGVLEFDTKNIILKDSDFLQKELGREIPIIFFDSF